MGGECNLSYFGLGGKVTTTVCGLTGGYGGGQVASKDLFSQLVQNSPLQEVLLLASPPLFLSRAYSNHRLSLFCSRPHLIIASRFSAQGLISSSPTLFLSTASSPHLLSFFCPGHHLIISSPLSAQDLLSSSPLIFLPRAVDAHLWQGRRDA